MKRVLLAEGLLDAEVPDDWIVRATTVPNGQRIDVAMPERYAGEKLEWLPESFMTVVHRTNETVRELAEAKMRQYVRQGKPDAFDDSVGAVPALGYGWTDGIRYIATWFVQPAKGIVIEAHAALPAPFDGRTSDPVAQGRTLLRRAVWLGRAHDAG